MQAQHDGGLRQRPRHLSRQRRHPVLAEDVRRQQDRSQALGHYALPWIPESLEAGWQGEPHAAEVWGALTGRYFNMRKTSIYGGSTEIQKNIVSKAILGL